MRGIDPKLIEEWKELLAKKLNRSVEEIEKRGLSAGDFSYSNKVVLSRPGDLESTFHRAFAVIDENTNKVAVFTEHVGYHVFNLAGMKVSEISTEEYWDEDYSGQ